MANLDILTADNYALINRAGQLGEKIKGWLRQGAENCRIIGDVRGQGLMIGIEMVEDKETKLQMLQNVPTGSLVIVLIDGVTGNPVWASAALGNVQQEISSDDVRKRLDYAVTQMFKLMKR